MPDNHIILAGAPVLHLKRDFPIAEATPPIDWSEFARAADLTRMERHILNLLRKGTRSVDLHVKLGVTRREAAQCCTNMFEKARRCGAQARPGAFAIAAAGDSLRPAFQEHLSSGRRVWTLGRLGPEFREIMQYEKKYMCLSSQSHPEQKRWSDQNLGQLYRSTTIVKTIEVLFRELAEARQKLTRIAERVHEQRLIRDRAEQNLESAQAELQADRLTAVLEERAAPGPDVQKKLARLQNDFAHAAGEFRAAEGALAQQRGTVMALEDELTSRRAEIYEAEIKGPAGELRALIAKAQKKATECQDISLKHQRDGVEQARSMVPYNLSDPWAGGHSRRIAELGVINALLVLAQLANGYKETATA